MVTCFYLRPSTCVEQHETLFLHFHLSAQSSWKRSCALIDLELICSINSILTYLYSLCCKRKPCFSIYQITDAAHPSSRRLSMIRSTEDPIELTKSSCSTKGKSTNFITMSPSRTPFFLSLFLQPALRVDR